MTLPACLLALALAAEPQKHPFDFADGDRVVMLGSTLIEREQKYGAWELALTLWNKDKAVTFRNLGWSGDTVWCESRGSFDGPKAGFERTVALVKELKPTAIVLCYGQVESFDGPDGVKRFAEGYGKLLDALAPTKARFVLMTPTPFEKSEPHNDAIDAVARGMSLSTYCKAVRDLAGARKLQLVDLFEQTLVLAATARDKPRLTDNGVSLSRDGYIATMPLLVEAYRSPEIRVQWHFLDLPSNADAAAALHAAILAKNELFFHRWRPQNVTYLTGFRKKEQGQNAKEIAEFDPLIEQAEKGIAELRKKIN